MNVTDDRKQTDGRAIAYSEREREFTFATFTFAKKRIAHVIGRYRPRDVTFPQHPISQPL